MTTKPFKFQLKDIQRAAYKFNGRALLAWEMGLGKGQPLDSKVLTPNGFVPMGSLCIGDHIIGSNGKPSQVIKIIPLGIRKIYRISFRDGSSCECTDDHLWNVSTPNSRSHKKPLRTLPLSEIRKKLKDAAGNCRYSIPMIDPVEFREPEIPLNPYLVGYLIANGCLTGDTPQVSIPDKETVKRIEPMLPLGTQIKHKTKIDYSLPRERNDAPNPLTLVLRNLGLMGCHSFNKKIPHKYLRNTLAHRQALLQGMMDGDGTVGVKDGKLSYCTTSKKMAKQFVDLVQSLGGTAVLSTRIPHFTHKGEYRTGRKAYIVHMSLPNHITPFRLSRKAVICKPHTKYHPSRAIVLVEYIGIKKCQCIKTNAADQLYVTNNYIVTHNSLGAALTALELDARLVIVVCPASVKWQWEREVKTHLGLRSLVCEGMTPPKRIPLVKTRIIIINYDILKPWVKHLRALRPDMVILDEIHKIKNSKTIRSKSCKILSKGIKYCLGLSGTPLTNRPSELFPSLNILWPSKYPTRKWKKFAFRYCQPEYTRWGWVYKGAANLKELHYKLKKIGMLRRLKKDVLKDLPKQRVHVVPIAIQNRKLYDQALNDFVSFLRKYHGKNLSRKLRAAKLTKRGYLRRLTGVLKLKYAKEWLDDFLESNDGKIIVFAIHKKVIRRLHRAYPKNSIVVDGSLTSKGKELAFSQFRLSKRHRILFGNIEAAGTGWNGQVAETVAFFELDQVPGSHKQAAARVDRIGQKNRTSCYYLIAKDTVEETISKLLQKKQKVLDAVLDGDNADGGLPIFDQLEEQLIRRKK